MFMELIISNPRDPAWPALHTAEATDPGKTLHKDSGKNSSSNWLSAKSSATKRRHTLDWSCFSNALASLGVSVHTTEHVDTIEIACTKAMAAALTVSITKRSIKTAPTRLSTWWVQHSLAGLCGKQKDFTCSHQLRAGCLLHWHDTATHTYWVSVFWGC